MEKDITLEDVILKYTPIITKYCLPKLQYNYHDAEEATSNVMITLYKKWDGLKKENIYRWLYKVADNHIKKIITKRAKDFKRESIYIDEISAENELFQDYTLSYISIEKHINDIISSLDEEERKLFSYRYTEEMKLREISAVTNIPYTTLHGKYSKLEKKVRDFIKERILLE